MSLDQHTLFASYQSYRFKNASQVYFSNHTVGRGKRTDDRNTQNILVDCTVAVDRCYFRLFAYEIR